MRIGDLNKVNYFDMLILKAILHIGNNASFREIKPYLESLAGKYDISKFPNSRVYFYSRLNELCRIGLIEIGISDVIKTWSIREPYKAYVDMFVSGYFGMLDKKERSVNE